MKLSSIQILLYIIFIISVIVISYYYSNNSYNINTIENFNNKDLTLDELKFQNDLENMDIKDIEIKTKIVNYLKKLQIMLKQIEKLNVPININNNGKLCNDWGMYDNGKYIKDKNNCIKIHNKRHTQCLSNNILTSCSHYYYDNNGNNINKLSKIDIKDIMDTIKSNIILDLKSTENDISNFNDNIDNVLNDLISKANLEKQQKYFIDYNNNNLNDKKILFDKTNKEYEKSENNVNINKIQFQEFLEKKEIINKKSNYYYYYIKLLIILLIFVGMLNFMFTELL